MNTLPYMIVNDIKRENERRTLNDYVTRCLRIITENTAKNSNGGSYLTIEYDDIINPKPTIEYVEGEARKKILSKLR